MLRKVLLFLVLLTVRVLANTETFSFTVPNYYNVPVRTSPYVDSQLEQYNSSTWVMFEFPIVNATNYDTSDSIIKLPYDFHSKRSQRLLVKLNNYANSTFDSNDVINVKLCWPATYPFNFDLSHTFLRAKEFGETDAAKDTLDIYIDISIEADFFAVVSDLPTFVEFSLVVSKLPNSLPIPIEVYSIIAYLVDVCILMVPLFPYIQSLLLSTILK
ncbi:hypothetical protein EJF18_40324 [Clavispora lusitaniae]|uniref:Uncharacterized protein n=1 Tax=Clavispora lusitaniae TaxID=36911 RepID=A0ACD0WL38_CLALS|nr:hypothetical protein E0198_003161 [Clavispora lusitaniae]KAF7582631.1 GPI-Mannosyltransferase II co-activator family protein [Clavispora lusitaniae]QFZ28289.1 hypothetical protein EJF14_40324 [Clavispora lusitaniae]QFZ33952.1 hypothetical protein EJF16_40324 [Clavispora lusitaniae]QFZ39636.1 hypothetical protein EJF15_40324 [Clavispora lusitaniae]